LGFLKLRIEYRFGRQKITVLTPLVLGSDNQTGRLMSQDHGGVRSVTVLSACTGSSGRLNIQVTVIQLNGPFVRDGQDGYRYG